MYWTKPKFNCIILCRKFKVICMEMVNVDKSKVSPMMLHYMEVKEKYKNTIVFYRLGDFYEMFFDDAIIASRELELTLTGRSAGLAEKVPMCGVPYHAKDVYIEKLIKKGYKVAICEQLEEASATKKIVKRDVVQVITAGTIINNDSLNEKENNYIGSIYDFGYCYVITYADITTGEMISELLEHESTKVVSTILEIGIKEIIANDKVDKLIISSLKNKYHVAVTITNDVITNNNYDYICKNVDDERYITSIKHVLAYLDSNSMRDLSHMQEVVIKKVNEYLKMDIHTVRNLELVENQRLKERTYSLLWLLDHTKTAMGSRKLKSFIENPILDKNILNKRYDIVSKLLDEFILADDLRNMLYQVYDLERLSGRISLGTCNARDLLQLKNSIKVLPDIKRILKAIDFYLNVDTLKDLYDLLDKAIYEEPPVSIREGYLIKEGYSKELDDLKDLRTGGKDFISKFESDERARTGIKNLKVGFNKVFGYYIEVSKSNIPMITEDMGYIRKQTLANGERYITDVLKEKEDLILGAEEKIVNLEYYLFDNIRSEVKKYIPILQKISKALSEIDVLQSFAYLSEKNNYVRPQLTDDNSMCIFESRHPVVENALKEKYVANDIVMDNKTNILLITGPNMAGKSTYMRQLGIIVIMAQIGCFVPAREAKLPIFDQIFTRIGASDDLVSGESTFMVEMVEASNAIKYATKNSLILFDELGRGTATFDGMSLAQAILEYIHDKIGCKTLFSTHYHELTDLEKTLPNLKNKHVSATEKDGEIIFLHKVLDGFIDKSYGINVAKLANLPNEVINRANDILKIYEDKERKKDIIVQTTLPLDFKENESEVEQYLKDLNILELTPIKALCVLSELKEKIKK